jgi:hypothetical protein
MIPLVLSSETDLFKMVIMFGENTGRGSGGASWFVW